ncbi:MAG TPA: SDR family oxidoreductase [Aggregatilineales bacterium]|nr:SDR family oxidoreductase [Aggregatilineales bacterium]
MDFRQQHAIITGGSSGIGKATAKLLASKGAHISIMARTQATLDEAKKEIEAARASGDQKVVALSADVSDRGQVEAAIQSAIAQVGAPDLLFTYAGLSHPGYFMDIPIDVFEKLMAVNYLGTLYAVRAVTPSMQQRRRGHIVLMSSAAGIVGVYGYTAYCPTKFAVRGFGETLRAELKPSGIRVSVVYPPDTDTPQLTEENKIKPLETKMISGNVKVWSADAVARVVLQGIERGAFNITPGLEPTLLGWLHSVAAPGLRWYFDGIVKDAAKKKSPA